MISFHYETAFNLPNEEHLEEWISKVITSENHEEGTLSYIFCSDEYLYKINKGYLNHDTYTDIISFDYSEGITVSGDIFISIDRVAENAKNYNVSFQDELKRVMVHGVLHYCGYSDKTKKKAAVMRLKEDEKIKMFHVEH
ncbi:rRNA maturation RNase YbeY [Leptobacterium sp. I13]|uniref:rRNA maturation RNase YbeY n=1 Tax=Leptobacterium meishanense TaxID=3128904 RepID=UPI0030EB707D